MVYCTQSLYTYAPRTADISEAESRFLVTIGVVIRRGITLRRFIDALISSLRRHRYLILRLRLLLHVSNGTRHESVDKNKGIACM